MRGETAGQMVRRLRLAKGWSQAKLAAQICLAAGLPVLSLGRQEVYRWEKGKRTPREWLPFIAVALEVPLAEMQIAATANTEGDPPVTVDDFLPEVDPLQSLNFHQGRRIGSGDVIDLAGRVHALRLADDVLAGGDLIGPALRELRSSVRLYRESSFTEEVGRSLLAQIGELAQICGWIASDAGRTEQADRVYRLGISAATQAQDAVLIANLAGSLAYQYSNTGRENDGLLLARAAWDSVEKDAPATAKALTMDRLAWAHTKVNESQEAIRSLGRASDALADDTNDVPSPNYLYWMNSEEVKVMEARVFTELHRPLRAVPQLREVLQSYDSAHIRETALYLSWLAEALADANEPEEAAEAAERVITLSTGMASERITARVRVVLRRLEEFRHVPEVRNVLENAL